MTGVAYKIRVNRAWRLLDAFWTPFGRRQVGWGRLGRLSEAFLTDFGSHFEVFFDDFDVIVTHIFRA